MAEVKNIPPVDRVAPGGVANLARDEEGFMFDNFNFNREGEERQVVLDGNCTNMKSSNIEKIVGGFYTDCVSCDRWPCDVESFYIEACEASDAVTRKTDYFLSEFDDPEIFLLEVATTGKAKNYLGVCWGRFLWFDIDREDDLESAVRDTVTLVDCMVTMFGLKPENIQIWFSGKKGFHVCISTQIFGEATTPSVAFHSFCKTVAERIGEKAGVTIDGSIYDNVRLLRCPNTRHSATGLFKTPVKYEELIDANAAENIRQRAESPRRLVDITGDCVVCDDDVTYSPITTCNPVAEQFWRGVLIIFRMVLTNKNKKEFTCNVLLIRIMPRITSRSFPVSRGFTVRGSGMIIALDAAGVLYRRVS